MNDLVVQQPVIRFGGTAVGLKWQWRDRFDNYHYPKDMETRHLFNTLRMIWNNTVPSHMRVGAVRLYRFRPFYSKKYMRQAIMSIGQELYRRTDMTPEQERELNEMESWFTQWREVDDPQVGQTKYLGVAPGTLGH